jgi:hypothetical protein
LGCPSGTISRVILDRLASARALRATRASSRFIPIGYHAGRLSGEGSRLHPPHPSRPPPCSGPGDRHRRGLGVGRRRWFRATPLPAGLVRSTRSHRRDPQPGQWCRSGQCCAGASRALSALAAAEHVRPERWVRGRSVHVNSTSGAAPGSLWKPFARSGCAEAPWIGGRTGPDLPRGVLDARS